jgi:hypothetical protein
MKNTLALTSAFFWWIGKTIRGDLNSFVKLLAMAKACSMGFMSGL